MPISDPGFFEEIECKKNQAIEELNHLIASAQRHIEMLSESLTERNDFISDDIAHHEGSRYSRALRYTAEHDALVEMHRRYN
jgi:hypothetical protein